MLHKLSAGSPGYTLAETLVAMMVLALLSGGLAAASHVFAREEATAAHASREAAALLSAEAELKLTLQEISAVISSASIKGDESGFSAQCATPCSVRVRRGKLETTFTEERLGGKRAQVLAVPDVRLRYVAAEGTFDRWPSGREGEKDQQDPLIRVVVVSSLITFSLPVPQRLLPDCEYDLVSGACRAGPA